MKQLGMTQAQKNKMFQDEAAKVLKVLTRKESGAQLKEKEAEPKKQNANIGEVDNIYHTKKTIDNEDSEV